jgi:hypothetical protein
VDYRFRGNDGENYTSRQMKFSQHGIEYDLALLAMALAVLIEGADAFSID